MPAAQASATVSVSIVTGTVAFCAKALPQIVVPEPIPMLAPARMFPAKVLLAPSVATLPTSQNTSVPALPLITLTTELAAVSRVLPIWKTKTAFRSFSALRVRVGVVPVVNAAVDAK